ncbi:outer membrane protein assembly factor BamB family protein [Parapedobacter flavus]|uniref:outer membrane protein assembly factor BamB family protein n=1 Tax=Parapedobacter flavus TaxID=3110225 RepID=UPI002DB70C4A|nr:PQQ-binding-like beta-propeller repeat protein [Parapedobacter sp. 10938]MEC3880093.1 PQQ-binding-like beta-propeller repeat protein [Parapedobacter sp. 10938]
MKYISYITAFFFVALTLASCKKDKPTESGTPIIDFSYEPVEPTAGEVVSFMAEIKPGSSNIVSWEWSFGTSDHSSIKDPLFTFANEGSFDVRLTATDAAGETATVTKTIEVLAAPVTEFPATLAWTFENNTPVSAKNDATAPAIGDDGVIYYVEGFAGINSKMVAVSDQGTAATVKWNETYGGDLRNAPAIGPDGHIYIGKWTVNAITKINSTTGAMQWEQATAGAGMSNSTTAIDANGNIYFASRVTASLGGIFSFAGNGTKRWEIETPDFGATYSSPAISKDGGTVYFFASTAGQAVAINTADGSFKWTTPLEVGSNGVGPSLSINSDGTIYVTTAEEVVAITDEGTSGAIKWKAPAVGANSSGVVIGPNSDLYVGSKDGLKSINAASGSVNWTYEAFMEECVPAVDQGGNVYFGDVSGKLYIVNEDGELQKALSLGQSENAVVHTPTIGDDGSVYVEVSDDGKVKLCKIAVENSGPADSPWPMKGQNRKHTGRAK